MKFKDLDHSETNYTSKERYDPVDFRTEIEIAISILEKKL